jgi:hypothetical protein
MALPNDPSGGKIQAGGQGLGEISDEMIEARAIEIARSDGRATPNEADLILARAALERSSEPGSPPEVDTRTDSLVAWDEAPESSGGRVESFAIPDEANVAERLVEEGVEEADHSQRLAASEDEELAP